MAVITGVAVAVAAVVAVVVVVLSVVVAATVVVVAVVTTGVVVVVVVVVAAVAVVATDLRRISHPRPSPSLPPPPSYMDTYIHTHTPHYLLLPCKHPVTTLYLPCNYFMIRNVSYIVR